ncbi:hypothetical protein PDESU_04853 [Pontiella desulfatans]|uniref:Carbohydrate-binding module family 96 domain-containing protein n=2 Tax=Pontiella desulfatans TaxID=2750659 RepID=A0A6C2U829_PONDE|nr:hypothetical protein PDESU_04853 [Pontiella desulfatans]
MLCTLSAFSTDYYVSTNGVDVWPGGDFSAPFASIQYAADRMVPGDSCYIRTGRYHEEITVSNTDQLTFSAYSNETVVLDGSMVISNGWTLHSGNIYKTTLNEDVWQLFADGEMLIPARWPNADPNIDLWEQWESDHWAEGRSERNFSPDNPPWDVNGTVYDHPHNGIDLAASGLDISNAIAVLNLGSFRTWTRVVDAHVPGSNMFTHAPVSASGYKDKEHYYFVEGKLELLDAENEWFYDTVTSNLYAWVPGGVTPASLEIRGKHTTYCFSASNCDDLMLSGIDFFAGTFHLDNCLRARVENCELLYPSCTKRMLRNIGAPETTHLDGDDSIVFNCTFAYSDGHGIYVNGDDNTVENCYFHHIDYSVSELPSVMAALYMNGNRNSFRKNTLHSFGASVGYLQDKAATTEYNNFYNGGYKQHDGAMVQVMVANQLNANIGWNWVHDWSRLGIRFDGGGGQGGLIHHSVGWGPNMNSTVYIGNHENNEVYNNSGIYSKSRNEIVVEHGGDPYSHNTNSITRNNIAPRMGGSNSGINDVPGTFDHNWNSQATGADIRTQLRDPDNLDFRPLPGADIVDAGTNVPGVTDGYMGSAPDIGAYEYGDSNYWIAGHQAEQASIPIPPNGTADAKGSASLMWHPALGTLSNHVYLGTSSNAVLNATHVSPEYRGNTVNNIYDPLGLYAQTYYWRIDCVTVTGTVKGAVWSFAASDVSATLPGIINAPAENITEDSAVIGGQITDGGTASQVWVHWWPEAGATNTVNMGVQDYAFDLPLNGLITNTQYYFQAQASNTYGTSWAPTIGSFLTGGAMPPSTKIAVAHLPVLEDSWVQEGNNEGVNHDGETILKVRGTTRFSYLKFDTGNLDGAQFDSARIFIRATQDIPDTSMHSVSNNSWTAPTLVGSNAPVRGAVFDSVTASAGDWVEFDSSSWITGKGVWSVALSTSASGALNWHAEESGNVPYLAVTYFSDTADLNTNTIPDWWETDYFGHIVDNTDADLDGVDNYGEYVGDTDPTDSNSVFSVSASVTNGADFRLSFGTSTNRNYAVKSSTNLISKVWNTETNLVPGPGVEVEVPLPAKKPEEFFRVEVSVP